MSTTVTTDVATHLRNIIEDAIVNRPRTLQVALGPSDLGTACDRCLIHLLAGHKKVEHVPPWLPTIGVAVHEWLEDVFHTRAFFDDDGDRWHIENRVTVGTVAGIAVHGSTDLFDEHTGTVVDWKLVGKTTLDKVRRRGASLTYQAQAHLYGKGWEDAGHQVNQVLIMFLPRNAVSLRAGIPWSAPYSRKAAELALERANALAAGIQMLGVDAVLAMTPPHTGDEHACEKWADEQAPDIGRQLAGLIPQTPGASVTGPTHAVA